MVAITSSGCVRLPLVDRLRRLLDPLAYRLQQHQGESTIKEEQLRDHHLLLLLLSRNNKQEQPEEEKEEPQQQEQQQQQQQIDPPRHQPQQQEQPPADAADSDAWILHVRLPPSARRRRPDSSNSTIRRIRVDPDSGMTAATLGACLQQALDVNGDPIAGLFQESTETFCSLPYILSLRRNDEQRKLIYAVELEPPPLRPRKRPWWESEWFLFGVLPLAAMWFVSRHYSPRDLQHWLSHSLITAYNVTIEWPLQELYRSGPWFLGWEGESLPQICARITYHGDAHFWESAHNLVECQRIFTAKQQAWLRLARPVVYLVLAVLAVTALRLLLREYWEQQHRRRERPGDRDMADLYRAFHVVLRQVQRATAQPRRHEDEDRRRRR